MLACVCGGDGGGGGGSLAGGDSLRGGSTRSGSVRWRRWPESCHHKGVSSRSLDRLY